MQSGAPQVTVIVGEATNKLETLNNMESVCFFVPLCLSRNRKDRRIIKVWKRAQDVINKWKQYLCHNDSQKIFSIFAGCKLGKEILDMSFEYMPDYKNKLTLKQCGIEYEHLLVKFIQEGLLPRNFFDIK